MKNRTIKLAIAAVTIAVAPSAWSFTIAGTFEAAWANPEVKFMVNPANCPANINVPGLIEDAVKLWNQVPTSKIKLSYGGTTTSTTDSSPPTVYCATNFGAVSGADQNQTVGVGRGSPSVVGGPITSGLLILNASTGLAKIANQTDAVLKVIVAHEIGHVLGLGHSQDSSALMWYTAGGKTNALLSQDDVDGISYLYPRNEIGGDQVMGCGLVRRVAGNGAPPSTAGFALALLLALPFLLAFRFRRMTAVRSA
jgi:hypothetical protein